MNENNLLDFLNLIINGCTWGEIESMFKADADSLTKQIYYLGRYYQCQFVGLKCTGVYEVAKI